MAVTTTAKAFDDDALPDQERIQKRAYELYVLRGNQSGCELDDWLQAEEELREMQEAARNRD